ncbi:MULTISPECIES: O-antigen ligase family protein [Ralstonia]|uniref:PglL family O-oligosaccharyltransferase n=1 Tax=Ralstonia TaxID=48736 RepID=UPI000AD29D9D|nr:MULTISPECIES: O-antigen ligase family protein [Ralstonia]PLT16844.1 polymerase [Ralstonia mannitolilytica]
MLRSRIALPLFWVALLACWVVPFLVAPHTYPIPTFYGEFATAICWVGLSATVLCLTVRSGMVLPRIVIAPMALVGVLLAQLILATPLNPFFSFAAAVFLLGAIAACSLGARSREMPGTVQAVAIAVIIGGVATAGIEFLQLFRVSGLPDTFFSGAPTGAGRRMWGNLNQPNHVATYLACGLAACLFLFQSNRSVRRLPLLLAISILLMGMALTFSRITWLHIVVIAGGAGLAMGGSLRGPRRWVVVSVPLVSLAATYQLCNWLVAYANTLWHLGLPTSMGERMQQGVGLREFLWNHAWHIFLAHPWLGGGWGDYAWNQFVQTDVLGHVEMSMNAHNIVLDLLAKVGAVGLVAVALPFLGLMVALRKRRVTPTLGFLYSIALVMVMHSMLEYPLHYLYFLLPFSFVLGYVDERNLPFPSNGMSWVLVALITVGGLLLASRIWVDYKSVERLYYAQSSPNGAEAELQRYQASGQLLLVPYASLAIANTAAMTREAAPIMAALEHQAVQMYPGSGTVQRWAVALAFQGKTDEAVHQVRRLRNQYWMNYAEQSTLLTTVCARKIDGLGIFCTRLREEDLLVEVPVPVDRSSQ